MKKYLIFALCLVMLASCLAGCRKENAGVKELSDAQEKGSIRIGVMACPPFAYHLDGVWTGFDIALAQDVCTKLGVTPEFVEVEWDNKYSALMNGEVDCLWCCITANSNMVEDVTFSQTYLASRPVLVTRQGLTDILTVAAERDSAAMSAARGYNPDCTVVEASSCVEAVNLVLEGKADAAIVDVLYANAIVNDEILVLSEKELGVEELAAVFRKDSDLVPAVNKALTELEQSGALANLAERYAMTDNLIVG